MAYVKIYNLISGKEVVVTRENALNRLKHNHFKNGGSFCAMSEVDYYSTPPPPPALEEVPAEEVYQLEEVDLSPPTPEEAEELAPVEVEQTVKPKTTRKKTTRSRSTKK